MPIWLSAILIMLLTLAIDAVLGDPPNRVHPLRWIGNMVGWLDRRIRRNGPASSKAKGMLAYILVTFVFLLAAFLISAATRAYLGEIVWIIVSAILLKITFSVFLFRRLCRPIAKDLGDGDLDGAAAKTQMIVSRRTEGMDSEHISSSCVETISENFADSVCSPMFYSGLFGLFGAIVFRCVNLMDAMWGYRNEKYGDIGYFAAKFDDVLGYLTSRLSVPFIALAAFLMRLDARAAVSIARRDHGLTASPNSGWPMAAVAGAMHVTMEKSGEYRMGDGPLPTADDIRTGYKLTELSSVLFILMIAIPLYMLLGIHVQMFIENLFIGVFP